MRLFDEETGYLLLDEIVEQRPSFRKVMEDGVVSDDEIKEQTLLVIKHLRALEERLPGEDLEAVAEAVCELAVLYEMSGHKQGLEG